MVQVAEPDLTESSTLHPLQPLHSRAADHLAADVIEQRILRTYVQLAVTPVRADGSRSATLARFGALGVRLTECMQPAGTPPAVPPFWLEIYSHDTGSTVDSCGCFEFDEAELAVATDLICEVCASHEREGVSSRETSETRHAHDSEDDSLGRPRRPVRERDGETSDAGTRLTAGQHAPGRNPLPLHLVL